MQHTNSRDMQYSEEDLKCLREAIEYSKSLNFEDIKKSKNEKTINQKNCLNKFIKQANPEWKLTIVDCHI